MKLDSKDVSRILEKIRLEYKEIAVGNSSTENPHQLMQHLTLCVFNLGRVDALSHVASAFNSDDWVKENLKNNVRHRLKPVHMSSKKK